MKGKREQCLFIYDRRIIVLYITQNGVRIPRTFLARWAAPSTRLLPLEMLLVAHRAHAVGARVAVKPASHRAKHGHLGLIRLLCHRASEKQGGRGEGWERASLG